MRRLLFAVVLCLFLHAGFQPGVALAGGSHPGNPIGVRVADFLLNNPEKGTIVYERADKPGHFLGNWHRARYRNGLEGGRLQRR